MTTSTRSANAAGLSDRRHFLSTLTAASLLTGSAALAAPDLRADHPDAELLHLAKDFERLHREWQDLDAIADRLEPAISVHFDKAMHTMDELWRARKETGYDAAVAVAGDKLDELDVVANRMRELPAQTLQGLVAKARLAQFDVSLSGHAGMKGPERSWDWDVSCMERFVREIERFASTQLTGGRHA